MSLLATSIGEWLQQNAPQVLGTVNPNNDIISLMFGSQGGF